MPRTALLETLLRRAKSAICVASCTAICAAACTAVAAAPQTFYGYDQGLGNSLRLPAYPLADAARNTFPLQLAAGVTSETFETVPVTAPVYALRTLTLNFGATTALLVGSG